MHPVPDELHEVQVPVRVGRELYGRLRKLTSSHCFFIVAHAKAVSKKGFAELGVDVSDNAELAVRGRARKKGTPGLSTGRLAPDASVFLV